MGIKSLLAKPFAKWAIKQNQKWINNPIETQEKLFKDLIRKAKDTAWGKKYDYASIKDVKTFAERVPIGDYDSHKPFINQMMHGQPDILWPGTIRWFSKSSGPVE